MGGSRGVCYVAYGEKARKEVRASLETLREHNAGLPVRVVGEAVKYARHIPFERRDRGGRWAKLNLDLLSPFASTLYLDADTRVHGDLSVGFQALDDGFDLVICPSKRQGADVVGHAGQEDRLATFDALGCRKILGLQAGVFWFQKGEPISRLFAAWRQEWERFQGQDQPALLRALDRVPVRLWLMSSELNGGRVVEHLFGRAR